MRRGTHLDRTRELLAKRENRQIHGMIFIGGDTLSFSWKGVPRLESWVSLVGVEVAEVIFHDVEELFIFRKPFWGIRIGVIKKIV